MSHEIRNPLVAIKTFAQLLPERFDDPDFRKNFNQIVVQEIDRLDKIVSQINAFAHPAELKMRPLDIRTPVKRGLELARSKFRVNGGVAGHFARFSDSGVPWIAAGPIDAAPTGPGATCSLVVASRKH